MLAAVREKVADDAEAGTVTAGGALRIGLFSEIVTETLLVTAAEVSSQDDSIPRM